MFLLNDQDMVMISKKYLLNCAASHLHRSRSLLLRINCIRFCFDIMKIRGKEVIDGLQ